MSEPEPGFTRAELIAEIAALVHPPEREEGEITTREYSEEMKLSYNQAERELRRGVAEGKLTTRTVMDNGKWTKVWRKKDSGKTVS